ncbi:MAG TPA: hypothetical protein VFY16_09250 [Gemmatimonadaceae bacterium]|nr:hypothetical protein [Gemmatimonadaceae bacterium]
MERGRLPPTRIRTSLELFAILYGLSILGIIALVIAALWRGMRALETIAVQLGQIDTWLGELSSRSR